MFRPYGRDPPEHARCFAAMERAMLPLGGRPHWAKVFDVRGRELAALYPEWDVFARVRQRVDPARVFWNDWAERVFGDAV